MGFLGTFKCDRCGYVENSESKENCGGSVTRYDAKTWLCGNCRDGLQKAVWDYIHKTGPYHHMNKEDDK